MSTLCTEVVCCFFFNDTATTEIYTLSLHDALPISSSAVATPRSCSRTSPRRRRSSSTWQRRRRPRSGPSAAASRRARSEEHTSELQSRQYLVCRLLLEKKKHQRS